MRDLHNKASALARSAQRRQIMRLAAHWRDALPGAAVTEETARVVIQAKGVAWRWLSDPMLRFAGSLRR